MNSRSTTGSCLVVVLTMFASSFATAQAPDCTGISDVSDFDGDQVSDFDGLLTTVRVASGLLRPLFVTSPPGDVQRLFVVEQNGLIKIVENGIPLAQPFLDVTALTRAPGSGGGNEEGLLGLAFHPDYAQNGWLFVYHTNASGSQNVLARYTRDGADPDRADPASRVEVLLLDHPTFTNHNGGMLAFGPDDGRLYVGTGDGGSSCDPSGNAQDPDSNLGKLLRLDVDALPYSTAGNPYDGPTAGNDEIWSLGMRNPWRFSFDRATGALYVGDVGQGQWEEVNCRPAGSAGGENYGWDRYEGEVCPNPSCGSQGGCLLSDLVRPVRVYDHATDGFSCSVTGGYVYRGQRYPVLRGIYLFGDYCSGIIWGTARTGGGSWQTARLLQVDARISSFGEDEAGELYLVDIAGGGLYHLAATPAE